MKYAPENYTITIKKETIEGVPLFVARVQELPDVEDYGDSYQEVYELIVETIELAQEAFTAQNQVFPEPIAYKASSSNGRVTLRLPKYLHTQLSYEANEESVSLNTYLLSILSSRHSSMQEITSTVLFKNFISACSDSFFDVHKGKAGGFTVQLEKENVELWGSRKISERDSCHEYC